jgi:hypothetical protein
MENVPKNRDRERVDAVLDWGAEGWRLAHVLRARLSKYRDAEIAALADRDSGLLTRLAEEES